MKPPGRRQTGRPNRRFMDVVREDLQIAEAEDAVDRETLKRIICRGQS